MATPKTLTDSDLECFETHAILTKWPPVNEVETLTDLAVVSLECTACHQEPFFEWLKWFDADTWDVFYERVHRLRTTLVSCKISQTYNWIPLSELDVEPIQWTYVPKLPCVCFAQEAGTLCVWYAHNPKRCKFVQLSWSDDDVTSLRNLVDSFVDVADDQAQGDGSSSEGESKDEETSHESDDSGSEPADKVECAQAKTLRWGVRTSAATYFIAEVLGAFLGTSLAFLWNRSNVGCSV